MRATPARLRDRTGLAGPLALCAAAAALAGGMAAAYALRVAAGAPADENSHLGYARLLADHLALPSAQVPEKQQPPLYYAMAALVLRAGGGVHAVRLLSVALTVITVVLVADAVRVAAPGRRWLPGLAALAVALLPVTQAVGGSISNDPLAWATGAAVIDVGARVLRSRGPSTALCAAIGGCSAAALLTKETTWPLVALLAVVVVATWGRRVRGGQVAIMAGIPLAVDGWWVVRNLVEFHSLLPPLSPLGHERQYLRSATALETFVSGVARSLLGPEDAGGSPLHRGFVLQVVMGVTASGIVLLTALSAAAGMRVRGAVERRLVAAAGAGLVLCIAAMLFNSVLVDLQPQARYLVTAAPIVGAALTVGAVRPGRTRQAQAGLALLLVTAALLVFLDADSLRLAVAVAA